jgi:hypothetical protein
VYSVHVTTYATQLHAIHTLTQGIQMVCTAYKQHNENNHMRMHGMMICHNILTVAALTVLSVPHASTIRMPTISDTILELRHGNIGVLTGVVLAPWCLKRSMRGQRTQQQAVGSHCVSV